MALPQLVKNGTKSVMFTMILSLILEVYHKIFQIEIPIFPNLQVILQKIQAGRRLKHRPA